MSDKLPQQYLPRSFLQVEHTATRWIFFGVRVDLTPHNVGPQRRHHRRCRTEVFPQCPQYHFFVTLVLQLDAHETFFVKVPDCGINCHYRIGEADMDVSLRRERNDANPEPTVPPALANFGVRIRRHVLLGGAYARSSISSTRVTRSTSLW